MSRKAFAHYEKCNLILWQFVDMTSIFLRCSWGPVGFEIKKVFVKIYVSCFRITSFSEWFPGWCLYQHQSKNRLSLIFLHIFLLYIFLRPSNVRPKINIIAWLTLRKYSDELVKASGYCVPLTLLLYRA